MEPDLNSDLISDLGSRRFFDEQLVRPLAYLRGLVGYDEDDPAVINALSDRSGVGDLDVDAGGNAPGSRVESASSLLKHLQDTFGYAPALDLPNPSAGQHSPSGAPPTVEFAEKRYVIEGELASGGMGKVLNAYDQDIRRRVAMKVLKRDCKEARSLAKFLEEAQATGQLEHPNIAPVYDLGLDPDYGVYFTMKLVRGRNLREIVRDLSIGRPETRKRFTLTRLLQLLQQVAMGVHYAHARGVIHRDLKPDNIMVGDFGEALVMDWGLAKIVSGSVSGSTHDEPVDSHRQTSGDQTLDGTISGTPAYMAPEQARGWVGDVDERTDIFGLGAILYEMLTYRPPYEGEDQRAVLARAGAGEIVRPLLRAPRNQIPQVLEEICMRALSLAKEDRYSDAMEFHEELQVFLDGTLEAQRRETEAATLARQGRDKAAEYRRLAAVEEQRRLKAQEVLSDLNPHDSHELKLEGWGLEDQAVQVRQQRMQLFNEATALLHSAINVDETCVAAKEALAELYWVRFEEAERSGNTDDMIIYESLVERYQQGRHTRLLAGRGEVSLDSDPPGAQVLVSRMVERNRRLVPDAAQAAGTTPLRFELPIGYYRITLRKDGYRDTIYPVRVERCDRHLARVNLYRDAEIGDGFVFLPAGECIVGGDPAAPGGLPLGRRYIRDLFVSRYPVSFRDYCRFLDDRRRAGDPDLEQWLPRTEKEGACVELGADGNFRPAPSVLDIDPATLARHPKGFEWDLPAFAVSWYAAARYAEWLSRKSDKRIRLLRDHEWEKAARGSGSTLYPWGDRFDWSFVKGGFSRSERAQPEPAGAFDVDCSLYGVHDLVGSIREWCEDWFLENKYRLTRGGGWHSIQEGAFRAAKRQGTNPAICSSLIGFRVACEPRRRTEKPGPVS